MPPTTRQGAPGRWRLRSLDLTEQLIEHPDQVVVIHTPEHLRYEGSSLDQKFYRKFQTHDDELGLTVCVLNPCRPYIGSSVVKNNIGLPVFDLAANQIAATSGSDIRSECYDSWNGLDWNQVNSFEHTV